jgi:hypothetical protein
MFSQRLKLICPVTRVLPARPSSIGLHEPFDASICHFSKSRSCPIDAFVLTNLSFVAKYSIFFRSTPSSTRNTMMFESNLTEFARIHMLEDRCRLLDEVIALRRERDALLNARSATSSGPITQSASYFGDVGYSQYIPPPRPPTYRAAFNFNPAAAAAYPAVFASLDRHSTSATTIQTRNEGESRHVRKISSSGSSDEHQVASPILLKPTMERGSSVVSPTLESQQAPSAIAFKTLQNNTNQSTSTSIVCKLPTKNRRLPPHFRLSGNTVVLGKGKGPKEALGNMRLKELVQDHLDEYVCSGRHGKMVVISNIIAKIQEENCKEKISAPSFVRFQDNCWWEVTEKECRIKLSSTFRDLLSDKYRSSSKSKVEQRRRQRQQQKEIFDSEDAVNMLLSLKA